MDKFSAGETDGQCWVKQKSPGGPGRWLRKGQRGSRCAGMDTVDGAEDPPEEDAHRRPKAAGGVLGRGHQPPKMLRMALLC